jgi:hypothetical protein
MSLGSEVQNLITCSDFITLKTLETLARRHISYFIPVHSVTFVEIV